MTSEIEFTDDELVMYLDGELDTTRSDHIQDAIATDVDLANRLSELTINTDSIRQSFDNVANAAPPMTLPTTSNVTDIQRNNNRRTLEHSAATPGTSGSEKSGLRKLLPLAAAVLIAIGAGLVTGYQFAKSSGPTENWHQAVVDYHQLYSAKTLPDASPDDSIVSAQLARVSETAGLTVTPEMISLPGLSFKRAQVLGYRDAPLIQLAFLDDSGSPVVLCFTATDKPASEPRTHELDSMKTVTWEKGGYGFILAGHTSTDTLNDAASVAATRF